MKAARYLNKTKMCQKIAFLFFTKLEGAYIGHQMYENTTKPNNLAKMRDKGVIHQN